MSDHHVNFKLIIYIIDQTPDFNTASVTSSSNNNIINKAVLNENNSNIQANFEIKTTKLNYPKKEEKAENAFDKLLDDTSEHKEVNPFRINSKINQSKVETTSKATTTSTSASKSKVESLKKNEKTSINFENILDDINVLDDFSGIYMLLLFFRQINKSTN